MEKKYVVCLFLMVLVLPSFAQDTLRFRIRQEHAVDSVAELMLGAKGKMHQRIILEYDHYKDPKDTSRLLESVVSTRLTYAGKINGRRKKMCYQVIVLKTTRAENQTKNWSPQLKEMVGPAVILLVDKDHRLCARVTENRFRFRQVVKNRYLSFETESAASGMYQLDAGIGLKDARNYVITKEKPGVLITFYVYNKPGICTISNWGCDAYDNNR